MNHKRLLIILSLAFFGGGSLFAEDADSRWPSAAFKAEDFGGGQRVSRAQLQRFLTPSKPEPFEDGQRHVVRQLNGEKETLSLPADIQWVSKPWNPGIGALPQLAYMSEKDRVLMLAGYCGSRHAAVIFSDDRGKTWSPRRWLSIDDAGKPNASAMGLTDLGQGKLICYCGNLTLRWFSCDYGQTWKKSEVNALPNARNFWDPLLVMRDANGHIERVAQGWWKPTGVPWGSAGSGYGSKTPYSQAYFRSSLDQGQTWSKDVKVPQWLGVNEVDMIVARNGDWVAACRTDNPERFAHTKFDEYSGLGISISKDQGKTWSDLNILYEWGRHHPSMVLLPDGRILMSYIVRMGYPSTTEGFPQFGVEAVLSCDNGQTWDLDHRYILAAWIGKQNITTSGFFLGAPQSSSTVLLPDGKILTAFATGFRNTSATHPGAAWKSDVMLVKWHLK